MKAYVQMTITQTEEWSNSQNKLVKCSPRQTRLLASDGIYILDGRQTLGTWIEDAKRQIERLRFVKPNITGFRIMRGNIRESTCIYEQIINKTHRKSAEREQICPEK